MLKKYKSKMYIKVTAAMLAVVLVGSGSMTAKAISDTGAVGMGFYVDLDAYNPVAIYNRVSTNYLTTKGKIIGSSTVDIGVTRAKNRSSGNYVDAIMARVTMKGKGSSGEYGYADYVELSSQLGSGKTLWANSPQQVAGSTSYTIGLNLGGEVGSSGGALAGGIGASQNFTKNALVINDYSDYSTNLLKTKFDYEDYTFRWDWDTYGTYMYNNTTQKLGYEIRTTSSKYSCVLTAKAKYDVWDSAPGYWANKLGYWSKVTTDITFTSAY